MFPDKPSMIRIMRYSDLFPGRMIENLLRTEDMRFL